MQLRNKRHRLCDLCVFNHSAGVTYGLCFWATHLCDGRIFTLQFNFKSASLISVRYVTFFVL